MNKITDANTIKQMILGGCTSCPDSVDQNIFNVMLGVVNAEKGASVQDASFEPLTSTAVATVAPTSTAVATPMNGVEFGLDDFESSVSGDSLPWIGMSNGIIRIGKDPITTKGEGIKAKMIGSATKFAKGIRVTNPADPQDYIYRKTYNGRVTADGEDWEAVVARAKTVNPNSYVYNLVELELELEEDILAGKKVLAQKGSHIKYANSPSAARLMKELSDECRKDGKAINADDVEVLIAPTIMTKKDGSTYQVLNVTKR